MQERQRQRERREGWATAWYSGRSLAAVSLRLSTPVRVATEATLDAYLLSLCDVLIGKHTSNLFRVAYELRAARCDCAPPFVSLDAPWCYDWGVFAGRSPLGAFPC